MADDRTQVNVRVDDAQHQRWKDYVEESDEYRHLTGLIRQAVEKEIQGNRDDGTGSSAAVDDAAVEQVIEAVERLDTRFDSVEATVESAAEEMRAEAAVTDDVVTDVFEHIPEYVATAKTPEQIAEDAGVSEREAALALAQLRRDTGVVKFMIEDADDEPSYWRDDS